MLTSNMTKPMAKAICFAGRANLDDRTGNWECRVVGLSNDDLIR